MNLGKHFGGTDKFLVEVFQLRKKSFISAKESETHNDWCNVTLMLMSQHNTTNYFLQFNY